MGGWLVIGGSFFLCWVTCFCFVLGSEESFYARFAIRFMFYAMLASYFLPYDCERELWSIGLKLSVTGRNLISQWIVVLTESSYEIHIGDLYCTAALLWVVFSERLICSLCRTFVWDAHFYFNGKALFETLRIRRECPKCLILRIGVPSFNR